MNSLYELKEIGPFHICCKYVPSLLSFDFIADIFFPNRGLDKFDHIVILFPLWCLGFIYIA